MNRYKPNGSASYYAYVHMTPEGCWKVMAFVDHLYPFTHELADLSTAVFGFIHLHFYFNTWLLVLVQAEYAIQASKLRKFQER